MSILWLISYILLWFIVISLGFLLLGTLRSLGLLQWRLDQMEATRPSRINREGLNPGHKAPDFTLPHIDGSKVSLHEFDGSRVLLVFVQANCGPCHEIVPALNRLQRSNDLQVLAINNSEFAEAQQWGAEVHAEFPVAVQDRYEISRKYQVFATPFAFLVNERGVVNSSGIVTKPQHLRFILDSAAEYCANGIRHDGHSPSAGANTRALSIRDDSEGMKKTNV